MVWLIYDYFARNNKESYKKKSKWSELDLKEKVEIVVGTVIVGAISGALTNLAIGFILVTLPTFAAGGIIGVGFLRLLSLPIQLLLAVKFMLSKHEGSVTKGNKSRIGYIIFVGVSFGIGGLLATTLGFTSSAAIGALSFLSEFIAVLVVEFVIESLLSGKEKEHNQTANEQEKIINNGYNQPVGEQESPSGNMMDNNLSNIGTSQSAAVV